jgi:hypothetical protein
LALEGRFENFTVGRAIEWEKVREIYKLGLKHGMKLAAISGVNGPFSDADIEKVRELALVARAKAALGQPGARDVSKVKPKPKGTVKTGKAIAQPAVTQTVSARKPRAPRKGRVSAPPKL